MKSVFSIVVVGVVGFLATAFDPEREMWAPLIVSVVALLVFTRWPVRDDAGASVARPEHKKAA